MSIENLFKSFELIEKNKEKCLLSGKKAPKLIELAQEELKINFPRSYQLFLESYGAGGLEGLEIFGVMNEKFWEPEGPDAIWITLNQRQKWNYPHHLIIIADTGDGYWYPLDSSKPNAEGEYPVVIYYDDAVDEKNRYEKVAEDFGDFLLQQVTPALEDDPEKEE